MQPAFQVVQLGFRALAFGCGHVMGQRAHQADLVAGIAQRGNQRADRQGREGCEVVQIDNQHPLAAGRAGSADAAIGFRRSCRAFHLLPVALLAVDVTQIDVHFR